MTDMARVLLIVGAVDGQPSPHDGRYLASYDLEDLAHRQVHGTGRDHFLAGLETTDDPARALRFDDAAQALDAWRAVSAVYPVRPWDGRPNRPLHAFTFVLVVLDKALSR